MSLDGEGDARIERLSFEAYNESGCLQESVKRFRKRAGHYPERVLADRIYRTCENKRYCRECGIRLSGPKLGRPGKTAKEDKKQECRDNTDIGEVERSFSLGRYYLLHIGDDVVIGAGSVVIKDVKSGCKVVGVPGKEMIIK